MYVSVLIVDILFGVLIIPSTLPLAPAPSLIPTAFELPSPQKYDEFKYYVCADQYGDNIGFLVLAANSAIGIPYDSPCVNVTNVFIFGCLYKLIKSVFVNCP